MIRILGLGAELGVAKAIAIGEEPAGENNAFAIGEETRGAEKAIVIKEEPGGENNGFGIGEELGTQLGAEKAIGIEEEPGGENKAFAIGEELGAQLGVEKAIAIEEEPTGETKAFAIEEEPREAQEESRGPKYRKIEKESSMKSPMGNTWRRTCGIPNGGEGRQFREPLRRIQCV